MLSNFPEITQRVNGGTEYWHDQSAHEAHAFGESYDFCLISGIFSFKDWVIFIYDKKQRLEKPDQYMQCKFWEDTGGKWKGILFHRNRHFWASVQEQEWCCAFCMNKRI